MTFSAEHLKGWICIISVLCSLTISESALSQGVFTPIKRTLQSELESTTSRLIETATAVSVDFVSIDPKLIDRTSLELNLPGVEPITMTRNTARRNSGLPAWSGSSKLSPATASFTEFKGRLSGIIHTLDGSFEVIPIDSSGVHAIVTYDHSKFEACDTPEDTSGLVGQGSLGSTFDAQQRTVSESDCVIRLLVAYTPGAQQNTMSLFNRTMIEHVTLAIEAMNAGFNNSLVSQRVELAYLYKTADVETGNITTDINALQSNDDGWMDEIHTLRDQYHADMVALITDGSYTGICGRAYGFSYASESNMFQISEYDCVVANNTLAHEFGHLQGARHDIDGSQTPWAFGHGYSQGSTYRTIMAVCCGAPRVNYWSNPYVYFPGVGSMGTLGYNYNARALNDSYETVAMHRVNPDQLVSEDMLMTDHIATNTSLGQITSLDTTLLDGCLILQSSDRIVLKPGFKASDGSLGTYRIISGCADNNPLIAGDQNGVSNSAINQVVTYPVKKK